MRRIALAILLRWSVLLYAQANLLATGSAESRILAIATRAALLARTSICGRKTIFPDQPVINTVKVVNLFLRLLIDLINGIRKPGNYQVITPGVPPGSSVRSFFSTNTVIY